MGCSRCTGHWTRRPDRELGAAYVYDEAGKPYAGVYRDDAIPTPEVFTLVTSDRGDVLSLLDRNGVPFAAHRYWTAARARADAQ